MSSADGKSPKQTEKADGPEEAFVEKVKQYLKEKKSAYIVGIISLLESPSCGATSIITKIASY